MLIDSLKSANIEALKTKNVNARNILSVVLNKIKLAEIEGRKSGKDLTDADVIAILMKTQKELDEELEGYKKVNNAERVALIEEQSAFVAKFVPKMMSEQEIKEVILTLSDRSIPAVMKHFKTNYAGACDMRTVQSVLKQL